MGLLDIFRMPSPMKVSGRSSTITAAFVSSIIPVVEPTEAEIGEALRILGLDPADLRCAYCGDRSTEWDHLRPLVHNKKPTGYFSEIHNLVPSCGKCNQSKGNTHWRTWMLGPAKLSPRTRSVPDLEEKVRRLADYERWGECVPLDFATLAGRELWEEHWANWQNVRSSMESAQEHAARVRDRIQEKITRQKARGTSQISAES